MQDPQSSASLLAALRARPKRPPEASFFFQDHAFGASVKVLPGEYFVHHDEVAITTTLGSCVAACLHDARAGVGGMNHFMLPDAGGDASGADGRYGAYAMELLINEMLKRGARRDSLQAKIFGGGQVMKSLANTNVGERNVEFVQNFLSQEGIPVLGRDVLDIYPRKICLFPRSGKVLCKRLASTHETQQLEATYRAQLRKQPPRGGEVELFT